MYVAQKMELLEVLSGILTLKSAAQFIHDTAKEKITAMNDNADAAPFGPVGDLMAAPWKLEAPVPAATHHTIKGDIQKKASSRWIQVIPKTQMIQTVVHMMSTPAHCGHRPSDRAASTDAPEMLLMAFQPVVETTENTTTRRLPQ